MSLQELLQTNEDFEKFLINNVDKLICLEVYTEVFGSCMATCYTLRKAKLDVGGVNIAMAKAPADKIDYLQRFKNRSEPIFLFIRNRKLSRVALGANSIELVRHLREELEILARDAQKEVEEEEKHDNTEVNPLEFVTQTF